jgi:hypothetical protein
MGKRWLASIRGLAGIFKDEEQGYAMLQWVADTFPNGTHADDALFTLAESLRRKGDKDALVQSVQHYRALLLRYPRCDVAAEAHLGLAATYEARDQGAAYHGGYVDVDPREPIPDDPVQLANAGPVISALEMAAYEYQGVFELLEQCPSLVSESQRSRAATGLRRVQERIASKEERIGASYGGRSSARGQPYYRAADARRRAAAEGRLWIESEEVEKAQKERRRLENQAAPVQPMPGQPVPAQPPGVPPPSSTNTPPPVTPPTPPTPQPPTPEPQPEPFVPPPVVPPTVTPPVAPAGATPPTQPPPSSLPPPVVRKVSAR